MFNIILMGVIARGKVAMTRAKKAAVITVSVVLALALIVGLILGLILWGIANSYIPGMSCTGHEYLQTIMADDVVYVSDEFVTINALEWQTFTVSEYSTLEGQRCYDCDVSLDYNSHVYDVPSRPTERVKGIDSYSYKLKSSEDYDGIPVTVGVSARTGNDRANVKKYTNEYGGYKYRHYVSLNNSQISIYNIKTSPRAFKSCILTINIQIENDGSYTDEQVKAREEEIFKSAVDNIIKYQG